MSEPDPNNPEGESDPRPLVGPLVDEQAFSALLAAERESAFRGRLMMLPLALFFFGLYGLIFSGFDPAPPDNPHLKLVTYVPISIALIYIVAFYLVLHGIATGFNWAYAGASLFIWGSTLYAQFYLGIWGAISMFVGDDSSFSILTGIRSTLFMAIGWRVMTQMNWITEQVRKPPPDDEE